MDTHASEHRTCSPNVRRNAVAGSADRHKCVRPPAPETVPSSAATGVKGATNMPERPDTRNAV